VLDERRPVAIMPGGVALSGRFMTLVGVGFGVCGLWLLGVWCGWGGWVLWGLFGGCCGFGCWFGGVGFRGVLVGWVVCAYPGAWDYLSPAAMVIAPPGRAMQPT